MDKRKLRIKIVPDMVQSLSEFIIETAESEDPMPGPTKQRNQSRYGGDHPQAKKTSVAGITYTYTKIVLNDEALQA